MNRESTTSRLRTMRRRLLEEGWTWERLLGSLAAFLVLAPLVLPRFQVYLLTELLAIALFATAFNLLYGYTGLLSFGHAMFYAAAGYGVAIFIRTAEPTVAAIVGGASPLVSFFVGGVVGILFVVALAIPVGYLSVRLEEIYFALITLSFGMGFYALVLQDIGGLTQGSDGLSVFLSSATVLGLELPLGDRTFYYYVVLAVVAPSMYALWRVIQSPFGRVCRAMRESPDRAAAVGIDVRYHQWVAFILSAVFAGIAGVLVVPLYYVVTPGFAHWTTSAIPVIAAVVGGAHYFGGPALGAFVYLYLRWGISRFPALEARWELMFGIVLLVVVLYFKQGVAGGAITAGRWLDELGANYRRNGVAGARTFVAETVRTQLTRLREASPGRPNESEGVR